MDFFKLYDKFLKDTLQGKRLQKNGKKVRNSSVEAYSWLRKALWDFSTIKNFPLHVPIVTKMKKREILSEKKYWEFFYKNFTNYLYTDLNCFDNYVGSCIKRLRTFFNYLLKNKNLNVGSFHQNFYTFNEEIEIITLLPEQLNFLIYNKEFEMKLPEHLQKTKDVFVFGCTVALRYSDIFRLNPNNIEKNNGKAYLIVQSKKTNTHTRILLPDYALDIIQKYSKRKNYIFQPISKAQFNKNIKLLLEYANWTGYKIKTRTKKGIPVPIYKNEKNKEHYRFCDLITSHTMRRTAITTMLCLGMPENLVRKISGHSANSKEFYRYVELSQKFIDTETEKIYEQLKSKTLVF